MELKIVPLQKSVPLAPHVKLKTVQGAYTLSRFGLWANASAVMNGLSSEACGSFSSSTKKLRPAESRLKKNEPCAPAGDCVANTRLALVATSRATQVKKARP